MARARAGGRSRAAARASAETLRTHIRGAGLRATAPRIAVLKSLGARPKPASHAELAGELAHEGWDRATIYRNLIDLTEAGLVRRTDLGDHTWRFELKRADGGHRSGDHPHFMCDRCGGVVCLPGESVQVRTTRRSPKALLRNEFEVQLKGLCDRCT